jgi:N-acetylglutamate synthase-like GNAT family acetyltransferase
VAAIRGYEPRDLEACRALWVELTQWHRDIFNAPEIGGEDPGRAFDEHLAKVGPENIWIAEIDGQVVGLAGLISDPEFELEPIIVSRGIRGGGVGRLLATAVVDAAREREARTVQVRPVGRNVEAIRFFHSLGFDVIAHVQLQMDLVEREQDPWVPGEQIADRDFRF